MAIYRKKLSKLFIFNMLILMILFVDIFVLTYSYKPDSAFLLSLIIGVHLVPLIIFIQFNYVIIKEDELIVGNGVYLFFRRKYKNIDIVNVLIGQGRTSYDPYIQIFTQQKKSRKFMLLLVPKPDLKKIVNHLEKLNVPVEFDLSK